MLIPVLEDVRTIAEEAVLLPVLAAVLAPVLDSANPPALHHALADARTRALVFQPKFLTYIEKPGVKLPAFSFKSIP